MGREAAITYEQVQSAAEQLHASGIRPTARAIRQALGNVGSMGTITRHLQQFRDQSTAHDDVSLRLLPVAVQRAVFTFIDQEVAGVHAALAEELCLSKREKLDLANENDRLVECIDTLAGELDKLTKERAIMEGRLALLGEELLAARQEISRERDRTRLRDVQLAMAQQRLDDFGQLERQLVDLRTCVETEREGRVRAEQEAAVLRARKADIEERLAEIRGPAAAVEVEVQTRSPRKRQSRGKKLPSTVYPENGNEVVPPDEGKSTMEDRRQIGLC